MWYLFSVCLSVPLFLRYFELPIFSTVLFISLLFDYNFYFFVSLRITI